MAKVKVLENTKVKLGKNTLHEESLKNLNVMNVKEYIPNGSNINNYKISGMYNINANNNATSISNLPEKIAGILVVYASEYFIRQDYTRYDGGSMWTRVFYPYGNSWSTWKQIF